MDLWRLKVTGISPEAKDTITIFLERADGIILAYQAGQFLTFLFCIHGRELRRSYSFSSSPGIDNRASITVKRVINGEVSRYLFDHLKIGDELTSLPSSGRFVLPLEKEDGWLFFIAAGSGVVPVFSLVKKAVKEKLKSRVILFSQHHDEQSILFKRQLEYLEKDGGRRFSWVNRLSNREGRFTNWSLEESLRGFFLLLSQAEQQDSLFYLCGPPAFMRMAQFTLRVMGIAIDRIKKENFTVEFVPLPPPLTDPAPKKIIILSGNKRYEYEAAWPATILQAGLKEHIPLPYSCRAGRCSACVARCLSGKVKMSINEVLTEKDLRQGLVLTCVGYAQTDVKLDFNS
ncbi:flavin reductase family protein [Flavitalea flava]